MSESRTLPVWSFLEFVQKKLTEMSLLKVNVIGPKENEILNMIFPNRASAGFKHTFNLLGRGFKQWQWDDLMETVFSKILDFVDEKIFLRSRKVLEVSLNFGRIRLLVYYLWQLLLIINVSNVFLIPKIGLLLII